jgi:hypothetical protein
VPSEDPANSDRWRLWNIYYDRMIPHDNLQAFLSVLPAADHLATFRWLFPDKAVPADKRNLHSFMLASFEEHAGNRGEALAMFRALGGVLSNGRGSGGALSDRTVAAIKRLSK